MKFSVIFVVEEFEDGNTVGDLQSEGVDKVINHDDILEPSVLYNPEIFDKKAVLRLHAVLTMQKSQNSLFGSVEVIDDGFSVVEGTGCENIDIVVLTHVG